MKPFSAFAAPGHWYRGNCHTHTSLSDCDETPEGVVAAYARAGYDFLVMTDHWKTQPDVGALQNDRLLVINGVELDSPPAKRSAGSHHIVALGVNETPPKERLQKGGVLALIRWVRRRGGIPVYAHPYWAGHDLDHMKEGATAFGVEVYNRVCETTRGLGDASVHLDQALSAGMRWRVLAVDDTHRIRRDPFGGWIVVKAERLSEAAILGAISRGHFYASTGPELRSVSLERGRLRVACSPVVKITWHCEGPLGTVIHAKRRALTRAETPVTDAMRRSRYLRLEVTDAEGRKAWTNPIYRNRRTGRWSDWGRPRVRNSARGR